MLIVLSGPGGSGKSTLARLLVSQDGQLWLSRSWTTRPQRAGEPDDAYHFVDRASFDAAIEAGGFLECATFGPYLYGTPQPVAPPGRDILLEIDVQGARQVRRRHPEALLLFLEAPSDSDQERRLRRRGDSEDHVRARLSYGPGERETARALGAVMVVNTDLDETVAEMARIIAEHRRHLEAASSPGAETLGVGSDSGGGPGGGSSTDSGGHR